jgi:hypothetical protein
LAEGIACHEWYVFEWNRIATLMIQERLGWGIIASRGIAAHSIPNAYDGHVLNTAAKQTG